MASLAIGPSLGHFYSGEVLHGVGMSAARGALVIAATGSLAVGAFQCFSLGEDSDSEPCEPSSVPYILSAAFAAGAVTLVIYDLVDAPHSARRARARRGSLSFTPVVRPDGGAVAMLGGTF